MELLAPTELARWIRASLAFSGYAGLSDRSLDVWRAAVGRGYVSAPPGFVASLLERLMHVPAGTRSARPRDGDEERLLELVAAAPAFRELEGEFMLLGGRLDTARALAAFERVAERAGRLYSPDIFFAAADLGAALALLDAMPVSSTDHLADAASRVASEADPTSAAGSARDDTDELRARLRDIYRGAIDAMLGAGESLDAEDLFEIRHPALFETPGSRSLHRQIAAARREIALHLGGDLSVPADSPDVVHQFGEPQMLAMGGFDAFTHRGELSSLVPSELALIDRDTEIDCFDYKYLGNELLYFAREEGVAFRIRRRVYVALDLSAGMEHVRHLAGLFGFVICFVERTLGVLVKDAVSIEISIGGHLPTDLAHAVQLFDHFVRESRLHDVVAVRVGLPEPDAVDPAVQSIYLGEQAPAGMRHVPFALPDVRELSTHSRGERARLLAALIDDRLEAIIDVARR